MQVALLSHEPSGSTAARFILMNKATKFGIGGGALLAGALSVAMLTQEPELVPNVIPKVSGIAFGGDVIKTPDGAWTVPTGVSVVFTELPEALCGRDTYQAVLRDVEQRGQPVGSICALRVGELTWHFNRCTKAIPYDPENPDDVRMAALGYTTKEVPDAACGAFRERFKNK